MSAFFHAKSVGFYTDEVHGPRTIFVPDPDWVRPKIQISDPDWMPSEAGEDKEAPLIDVDDSQALAPQIEVPNPKCSFPPVSELVEVTQVKYLALLAAQSEGKVIQANTKGLPVAIEPPPPSDAELIRRERLWRDRTLAGTDSLVVRHRDELEAERATTLTADQYRELQTYRLALRDWTQSPRFPAVEHRPSPPTWLAALTQQVGI